MTPPSTPSRVALAGQVALVQKYFEAGLDDQAAALAQSLTADSDAVTAAEIGLALQQMGRPAEAAEAYRIAVARQTPFADAWNNLGLVLEDLGSLADAKQAYETAIAQNPDSAGPRVNLGALLSGQGLFGAAVKACTGALEKDPEHLAARINLGGALLEQGRHDEAQAAFQIATRAAPENPEATDGALYLLHYVSDDPAAVMKAHRQWGQAVEAQASHVEPVSRREGRMRVGYVSPDFRRHSVSFFAEPLLQGHDRSVVEVFCYADGGRADVVTARLQGLAEHWRDIQGWSDDDLAAQIARDGIDILVDLAGHTTGNRLRVFARRAAPIQVTAIGYPGTTGLSTILYRLCDGVTDPDGSEPYATERLVRLPRMHCYLPPADMPSASALPAIAAGHVTFGSFNKLGKVSDETVALWAAVLKAVPGSRLFLKSKALAEEETRQLTTARFAHHGIAADRLTLFGWVPEDAGHLSVYARVDIGLDTFPYSGTTTTCEALWMGVPVLTMTGATHASRVSASLLDAVALPEWIAASAEDMVARAQALAGDLDALATLRAGLRARMAASQLCDHRGYGAAVEEAYRGMLAT